MSSTGVRESNSTEKRVIKGLIQNEAQFIQSLRVFANTSTLSGLGATGGEINNSPQDASGNYLSRLGDKMLGPLALSPPLDFRIEIDVNKTIDIGPLNDNPQYTSNVQLDSIQPNGFVLDIIAGAAFDGQLLILRTFAPSTPFTISQGTLGNGGNIQTPDISDVTGIGDLQMIVLVFDASLVIHANTGGTWRLLNTFGSGGGGGGFEEPVIFGINTLTPQTPPTKTFIAWNTKNPHHIILDRAVEFDFTNLPISGKYEGILVIIDIDGIGGFDSPIWPASLTNPPVIPTTPNSRFSVMLFTIDNGTIVTNSTSVGSSSSGSGFSGNLSDLVINVNKNWQAQGISNIGSLTGVTGITGTGSNVIISGIAEYDFFQTGHSFQNKADPDGGILYNVNDLQSHIFRADTVEIARFEESTSLVYQLDMLNHAVKDVKDISFDVNAVFAGSGAVPTIGYHGGVVNELAYNVPDLAKHVWTSNNIELMGLTESQLTFAQGLKIQANPNATNPGFSVGSFAGDPASTIDGDIWYNSLTNKYRISENGIDLNILTGSGTGFATRELDNLTTTAINSSLLPQASATLDLGSELLPWRIAHVREIEFPVDASVPTGVTDTQISKNASGNLALNNSVLGGGFLFYFQGVNKWSILSETLSGDNIILQESLVFNDSLTNPTAIGEITRNANTVKLFASDFELRNTLAGAVNKPNIILYKNDPSPDNGDEIGSIRFDGNDNGNNQTQYAQVLAGIGDVSDFGILLLRVRADNIGLTTGLQLTGDDNVAGRSYLTVGARINSDLSFGFDGVGSLESKISPVSASTILGIVVQDNTPFNLGSEGMLATPVIPSLNPSLITLDNTFGNHVGATGVYNTSSANVNIAWKSRNDEWVVIAIPSGLGTVVGEHFN